MSPQAPKSLGGNPPNKSEKKIPVSKDKTNAVLLSHTENTDRSNYNHPQLSDRALLYSENTHAQHKHDLPLAHKHINTSRGIYINFYIYIYIKGCQLTDRNLQIGDLEKGGNTRSSHRDREDTMRKNKREGDLSLRNTHQCISPFIPLREIDKKSLDHSLLSHKLEASVDAILIEEEDNENKGVTSPKMSPVVKLWQKAIRKVIFINKFMVLNKELHTEKVHTEESLPVYKFVYIYNIYIYRLYCQNQNSRCFGA